MLHESGRNLVDQPLALVVDRDVSLRAAVREALEQLSVSTLGASTGAEARERLRDRPVGVLVLGDCGGNAASDVARQALELQPPPVVMMLVGEGAVEGTRELLSLGVFDVVAAPHTQPLLESLALRAKRQLDVQQELLALHRRLQSREGYHRIVGRSPSMERVRREVDRLAQGGACVWLCGEAGTGKHLVARSLHAASARREHPFVVVHCAGVDGEDPQTVWSRSFAEDTGAEPGWFERADGGSLFLDGITELPLPAQESLIRELKRDRRPDVRILVASSASPRQAIEGGHVVEELRDALAPSDLALTALADRSEDLALLARHFISSITEINHLPSMRLAPDALALLERHHWPGNVRELRNAIEHAVILATDGIIRGKDLPDHVRESQATEATIDAADLSSRSFRDAKREVVGNFEQAYLADLLRRHEGNVTSASQQAGMLRSALQRLLRKYGLKSADFRQGRGSGRRRRAEVAPPRTDDA